MSTRVLLTAEQVLGPVPGGVGRYVAELARHLPAVAERHGGSVRFVTGRHPAGALGAVGLDAGATTTLALPGRVLNRTWVRMRSPRLPARLLKAVDVVHATSAAVPPPGSKPLVVTVHDLGFHHHPEAYPPAGRAWHERSMRLTADEAALILVPSAATAADCGTLYGIEPDRIAVTPLGADPAPGDQAATHELLAGLGVPGPFLLAVGTLEPRKNLPRLLAAFAEAGLPGHHLVVAGPSGWGETLGEVPPRVVLAGRVPDPVLRGLYELADGLAYPSLYEGFGLPVVEAMAAGTPVLTSTTSSLPEVAGDAALLVDPADADAIAAGLHRLVTDQELRRRLRAAGPERAARFTWPACAEATWAGYERARGR